jgi:two-component system, sensor histidine kinase
VQLGNPERDREKGVGLGLSIVNAIVNLLDEHRLDMRSWQHRGTRFSLELPYGDEAFETALRVEVTRPPGGFDLSGLYAFYVEDDPLVRRSTISLFEALGMRFEAFGSLAELEAALPGLEREPDLLVSDYRLPHDRTARDVHAAVEAVFGEAPPMLVVTGEMGALGGGRWPGPTAVLRKPVTPEVLVLEISALCVRGAAAAEPLSPAATPRSAAPSAEPL